MWGLGRGLSSLLSGARAVLAADSEKGACAALSQDDLQPS